MTLPNELLNKIESDMKTRLNADGTPRNRLNDYERHLYARYLRLQGKEKTYIWAALLSLGLDDVARPKRSKYLDDVIASVIVGFPDATLPAYQEIK